MQFNFHFNIKPTKVLEAGTVAFAFIPEIIDISIGEKQTLEDGIEVLSVTSTLRQNIEGGYTVQVREQKLPVTILSAINGFDVQAMQPTVNPAALNQILSPFNLEVI